jgi:hypothetical protein
LLEFRSLRRLSVVTGVVVAAAVVVPATAASARPKTSNSPTTSSTSSGTDSTAPTSTNLLTGDQSTFSRTTGGWVATGASLSRVSSPYLAGAGALSATATAAGNVGLYSGSGTSTYTRVTPGATYAADAWVRAAATSRPVQSVISWYDGSGRTVAYSFGGAVTDTRQSYVLTATSNGVAPAGAQYASLGLVIYGVARGEVHYVDAARFEQTASPQTPTPATPLVGAFDAPFANNNYAWPLDSMEQWQGRRNAVLGIYTNFDSGNLDVVFPKVQQIWARGSVPMVSWMPWIGNDKGPNYNAQIAGGSYDSYIRTWAGRMKTFLSGPDGVYGNSDDRRAYLRFAHEPNGDWYPYSPAYAGTPANDFIAMWRHVHDIFVSIGVDDPSRLAWVFSVNNVDSGVAMETMWPGEAYVDWVGIDGYDWGSSSGHTWQTPSEVFDPMVKRLRSLTTKPLGIDEVGATIDGASVAAKASWIADYFTWVKANDVRLTMWFNAYPDTWVVFGGTYGDETFNGFNAYSTYRAAMQDPVFVSPDAANVRLVTDTQFTGR